MTIAVFPYQLIAKTFKGEIVQDRFKTRKQANLAKKKLINRKFMGGNKVFKSITIKKLK